MKKKVALAVLFSISSCAVRVGHLPYRVTDGEVGYSERLGGEVEVSGKKFETFAVRYEYTSGSSSVEAKALKINLFYRAAEFTKQRGSRHFVLMSLPEGTVGARSPYRPQELPGTQGMYRWLTVDVAIAPFANADDAQALAESLPHKVVYDADKVMSELAPFVAGVTH